jgi:hypothetical protein
MRDILWWQIMPHSGWYFLEKNSAFGNAPIAFLLPFFAIASATV